MPPTGPTTAAGKKRSAANALKHGLLSERVIVDDLETQEDWERHRHGIVQELGATGVLDHTLGEQIASVLWRLARCSRAETGAINQRRRKVRELLEEQGVRNPATGERHTLSKAREEAAGEVERLDWLRSLPGLSDTLGLKPRQHEELLIEAYLAVEERAPRAVSEELRDWIDAHQAFHTREGRTTTVGTLREGFRHFASRTRMSLEDVYGVIIEQQELRAARLALEVQRAETQLRAALEEAQLPEEADLQRYIRYEAHLGRQLARLHRLLKDHHQAQAAPAEITERPPSGATPAPPSGLRSAPSPDPLYPYPHPDLNPPQATPTPTPTPTPTLTPTLTPTHLQAPQDSPSVCANLCVPSRFLSCPSVSKALPKNCETNSHQRTHAAPGKPAGPQPAPPGHPGCPHPVKSRLFATATGGTANPALARETSVASFRRVV